MKNIYRVTKKEGISSFNSIKASIELEVRKEKKAQLLIEKMSGKSDLNQLASELKSNVDEAKNINFDSSSIPGAGFEPAIVGASTALEANQVSKPVQGNNGVYVVKVTNVIQGTDQDIAAGKQRLSTSANYRASSLAFEALRENAKIVDKRAKFY